ncbi:hypothetical protein VA602_03795 [Pseudomonas sp. MH2]|uniref:DUF3077 domain-containing protein n=1 Tax=Pseudomonas machongensis TaxID=3110229 RepID=A0ABU5VAR3_9PSED|nr:hypothetical protein [Pseudomonas sp. MH2]MEA5670459.1 hypothetical protein [Pseudomonas sp. MH2]
MTSLLMTCHAPFRQIGDNHMFAVQPGVSCSDALSASSELLQGAEALCNYLIDANLGAAEANACKALIQQARALVNASVLSVERAEHPAPKRLRAGGAA